MKIDAEALGGGDVRPSALERGRRLAEAHHHLLRYFIIGATASLIDVGLFLVLFNLVGTTALIAHSVSVPTAVVFSFLMNARHNFRTDDYMLIRLASFVVVCIIGYGLGLGIIELAAQAGIGVNAGKILSLPVVFVAQYLLNSRITFRKASTARPGS